MNQPGTLMLMVKHASLALGVSETSVKNWCSQGRLPSLRIEVVATTLVPAVYIEALLDHETYIGAAEVDAFRQTAEGKLAAAAAHQEFLDLLAPGIALEPHELTRLFGLNQMVIGRWQQAELLRGDPATLSTATLEEQSEWRGLTA